MEFYPELKLKGDFYNSHYTTGLTFYDSETAKNLKKVSESETTIVYEGLRGTQVTVHRRKAGEAMRIYSELTVGEDEVVEYFPSVAVRGVQGDFAYRLRSFWSAEGRLVREKMTDLGLEASWCDNGVRVVKFGTVGSLPVREYFPFLIIEDSKTGAFTGLSLYAPCSWQIEMICQYREGGLTITAGSADADYGQFQKRLKKGETYQTQPVLFATGKSLLEVCDRLVKAQTPDISPKDDHMAILFNEYCTTWGNPTHENIVRIADKLEGKGCEYFVIDCGWYARGNGWWDSIGDWEPDKTMFPEGLKRTADYIREKGMIPGIWFELENVGRTAKAFHLTDHLLKRDGEVITVENRRFWDMADPWVVDYLSRKVIGLLKECGFGYLKVDYNESIGTGADGYESLGEGLRKRILGTQDFFRRIKEEIPDIVIENCASGGHRLEPSMMELFSQASFSDAHECASIPVIAANLHRAVRPEQSQIWAVIQKSDDERRLCYSLVNTFLGRMCLSGDILDLDEHQWKIIRDGMAMYRKCAPVIQSGTTTRIEQTVDSYNDLCGEQILVRETERMAMVVAHRFGKSREIDLSFTDGWRKADEFGTLDGDFCGKVLLFEK